MSGTRTVQPVLAEDERDATVTALRAILRKQVLVEHDADLLRGAVEGLTHAPAGPRTAAVDENAMGRFRRESPESRAAALANFPRSGSQRLMVLRRLSRAEGSGMTREELAHGLGLAISTVNPRVRELIDGGWAQVLIDEQTGRRVTRPTRAGNAASVLVVTDRAHREMRQRSRSLARQ